jgi:hypothetical protein
MAGKRTPRPKPGSRSVNIDTIPSNLPTEEDLRGAEKDLMKAVEAYLHVWWMMERIARAHDDEDYPEHALVPGDERPSFAHVGRLLLFAHDSQSQLAELADTMNKLPETIKYLSFVVEQEARRAA